MLQLSLDGKRLYVTSSLSIKTQLQHLWGALNLLASCISGLWLHGHLLVLDHLDRSSSLDQPAEEYLSSQLGVPGVSDVVLPHVSVQPVGEVEEPVVHADQDVRHHSGHLGHDPPLNLLVWDVDHLLRVPVALLCFENPEHVREES